IVEGPGLAELEGDGSESVTEISLNHADNAKDFLSSNKDFYRVYDVPGQPIASWMGSRYVISDDTSPIRAAVRDFLNSLHDSLPAPKKGRDYRAKLKS